MNLSIIKNSNTKDSSVNLSNSFFNSTTQNLVSKSMLKSKEVNNKSRVDVRSSDARLSDYSLNGNYQDEIILKNKYTYNKNGVIIKTTFLPPTHIFPKESNVIKGGEYTIIISSYFSSLQYFEDYITTVSPTDQNNKSLLGKTSINSNTTINCSRPSNTSIDYSFNLNNLNNKKKNVGTSLSNKNLVSNSLLNNSNISQGNTFMCGGGYNNQTTLGPIIEVSQSQDDDISKELKQEQFEDELHEEISTMKNISVEDFEFLEVIGVGYYGKVKKVKYKKDGKIYAMKILKKSKLKELKRVEHTKSEKKILSNINHPFIVSLKMAFKTQYKLFLVMEYVSGGELLYHMKTRGKFSEKEAIFYTAQIVCALDFLHENKIIYRDLKPENIVLFSNGYIKLTDFGLSKENIGDHLKTDTFVGTPAYLSPEIVSESPYNSSVDMWALGVIYYEMIYGHLPFHDDSLDKLYKMIYVNQPKFNSKVPVSDVSIDFIKKLLCKDPEKRITIREAKKHEIFKGFNFEKLCEFELEPPILPNTNVNF